MPDIDTRNQVAGIIKDGCTLRSVLKPTKLCPYFGESKSCHSCSYDWLTIADGVAKVAAARRVAYEKEREKRKEAEAIIEDFQRGINAVFEIANRVNAEKEKKQKHEESNDDKHDEVLDGDEVESIYQESL